MRFLTFLPLVLCLFNISFISSLTLEEVKDAELVKLINQEQYVIALFSKFFLVSNVRKSDKTSFFHLKGNENEASHNMETELAAVREDLVETINAWVVKVIDSQMKSNYAPDSEPQIVFFRKASPVLYTGPADEEVILETLMAYRETCTKDLTDTSFEHLTQAGTGATTGDWLVMFFKVNDFSFV